MSLWRHAIVGSSRVIAAHILGFAIKEFFSFGGVRFEQCGRRDCNVVLAVDSFDLKGLGVVQEQLQFCNGGCTICVRGFRI